MNKFTKIGAILVMGASLFSITGCLSTDMDTGSNILDTLVAADIITLPSINLDFVKNERIEITDKLLNTWASVDSVKGKAIEALKSKLDVKTQVKHYLTQTLPDAAEDYFPITVEELGTLYVVAESLYNN